MVYSGRFTLEVKIKHRTENKPYVGRTLFDINCKDKFFYLSPRIMDIKRKISKWDILKLESFTAREQ